MLVWWALFAGLIAGRSYALRAIKGPDCYDILKYLPAKFWRLALGCGKYSGYEQNSIPEKWSVPLAEYITQPGSGVGELSRSAEPDPRQARRGLGLAAGAGGDAAHQKKRPRKAQARLTRLRRLFIIMAARLLLLATGAAAV